MEGAVEVVGVEKEEDDICIIKIMNNKLLMRMLAKLQKSSFISSFGVKISNWSIQKSELLKNYMCCWL